MLLWCCVNITLSCLCRLEEQGRLERALVCYQEALADDPAQEAAKTKLEKLRKVLEKKVSSYENGCCVPIESWLSF